MSDEYMSGEWLQKGIEADPNDFYDLETDDEVIHICNIFITRNQIEQLLSKGQVDVEPIEEECIDCSTELTILPTLILKD